MDYLFTAIIFLVIFSILVLVHECGHFLMAKRAGIKVEEFGFGLPPRLWGKKKGETIYSINWIPFGGFVRMLGEDSRNSRFLKNKRSFIAQSARDRFKVLIAGVVMNFLLAWILLSIGLSFGMQPLLLPDDVYTAIDSGMITLDEGAKVKTVDPDSVAYKSGIKDGDVLYSHDGSILDSYAVKDFEKSTYETLGKYIVYRDGQELEIEVKDEGNLGITFYDYTQFTRARIFSIDENSDAYEIGLRAGDILTSVNGNQVYDVMQFEELIRGKSALSFIVYRDGKDMNFVLNEGFPEKVIIASVIPQTPAFKAGFQVRDVVVSVEGTAITNVKQLQTIVKENDAKELKYVVSRNGQNVDMKVIPEDGEIGVYLSELIDYNFNRGFSLYNSDVLTSVTEIKNEQYPIYKSIYVSFYEMVKMGKVTAEMFVDFVKNFVIHGSIPAGVAGPVGIAQMTHIFAQEGFIPILRFMAILSLSLAVINVLPFPALDGGRILFVLIEVVIGRRINQKAEAIIHGIGYGLILILILAVTYSDILRLIGL